MRWTFRLFVCDECLSLYDSEPSKEETWRLIERHLSYVPTILYMCLPFQESEGTFGQHLQAFSWSVCRSLHVSYMPGDFYFKVFKRGALAISMGVTKAMYGWLCTFSSEFILTHPKGGNISSSSTIFRHIHCCFIHEISWNHQSFSMFVFLESQMTSA